MSYVHRRQVIWKYPLQIVPEQTIQFPSCPWFRHLALQDGVPTLWVQVNPTDPSVSSRRVIMRATGEEWDSSPEGDIEEPVYLGTVQVGALVWHYFVEPHSR